MFHHFHSDKHPKGQGSIDSDQFDRMLNYLDKNYDLLDAKTWYHRALGGVLGEKDVCLTFDDNLLCQYEVALPVMEKYGITAFWFLYTSCLLGVRDKLEVYRYFRFSKFEDVNEFYDAFEVAMYEMGIGWASALGAMPSDYLAQFPFYTQRDKDFRYIRDVVLGKERYGKVMDKMISDAGLDVEQISRNLFNTPQNIRHLHNTGHIIGLHSHSHPTQLAKLDKASQKWEYETNSLILSEITGVTPTAMSHPCNSYNNDTLEVLTGMGIKVGFRANMEAGYHSHLEYPRLDHTYLIDKI